MRAGQRTWLLSNTGRVKNEYQEFQCVILTERITYCAGKVQKR